MRTQAEAVANGTVTCVMCENKRISKSLQDDLSLVINAANAEKSRISAMHFQVLCALNALPLYSVIFYSVNCISHIFIQSTATVFSHIFPEFCGWGGRRVSGYLCE